jgi:hypothetical protein
VGLTWFFAETKEAGCFSYCITNETGVFFISTVSTQSGEQKPPGNREDGSRRWKVIVPFHSNPLPPTIVWTQSLAHCQFEAIHSCQPAGATGLPKMRARKSRFKLWKLWPQIRSSRHAVSSSGLGVVFRAVMRAIEQMEKRGIVKEISGARRDRVYCAEALLEILEEPAPLQPAALF